MWTYQYKHGDKPLDGYTIERAAGRGGFGEVYYAVSDAGREVALKVVTGYEQIELRGISQCMNLKSPHLVTIFDVKHNAEGKPFVIMEFVAGPSLRQLLDENPSGLGEQKAAFFLREIGKGMTYLHDCGIVHRDLKPGNIFYENGYVKIGDYGLSKAMSVSQHSGQTVTVGTVHYMAPEIGAGKYDRSIDIYALGAVLYEMLTGLPPFVGASPSEILLKHLSATPDCSAICEPFATAIKRAMAKNPDDRYKTVQEMVEAVFGAEHIQQSVSVFSPEELSVVAGRVAQKVTTVPPIAGGQRPPESSQNQTGGKFPPGYSNASDPWERMAQKFEEAGKRLADGAERIADGAERVGQRFSEPFDRIYGKRAPTNTAQAADPSRDFTVPLEDPLPRRSRIMLGIVAGLVVSFAAAVLSRKNNTEVAHVVGAAICGAVGGLMLVRFKLARQIERETPGMQRLLLNGSAVAGMLLLGAMNAGGIDSRVASPGTWLAAAAPIFFLRINRWLTPARRERVSLGCVIAAGAIAFGLCAAFDGNPNIAVAVAAGTALVAQVVAPWDPRRSPQRQPDPQTPSPKPMHVYGNVTVNQNEAEAMRAAGVKVYGNMNVRDGAAPPAAPAAIAPLTGEHAALGTVPAAIRYAWLGLFALAFSLGIAFTVAAGNTSFDRDIPPFAGLAVGSGGIGVLALIRSFGRNYFGLWNYFIRPLAIVASLATSFTFLMTLINSRLHNNEIAICTFLFVFPLIAVVVALFIPGKRFAQIAATTNPAPPSPSTAGALDSSISPFKRLWALLMSAFGFFGACGIQRFYVGKIGTGVLWMLTAGLFGVGQIVDVIMILSGTFTDKDGRPLIIWEDENELGPQGASQVGLQSPTSARRRPQMSTAELLSWHAHGLLSALAGLLLFIGAATGFALALQLPAAIAAGVFDPHLAQDIQTKFFNGYADWPRLAERVGSLLAAIELIAGVIVMLFARRRLGGLHMLRGCVATLLLVAAMTAVGTVVQSVDWNAVAVHTQAHQIPAAIDEFFSNYGAGNQKLGILTIVALFISALLFAWPGRRPWEAPQPQLQSVKT